MAYPDVLDRRVSAGRRPRTRWFEHWEPVLDDALRVLPESETCSHDLFRVLATNASPAPKRLALVLDGEDPIAVVALRKRNYHWDLVTEGVVPYAFPPCAAGREIDALHALGLFVWVNEWERPLPRERSVRFVQHEQVFQVSTRTDFDAFWRQRGNMNSVKKARRRSQRFGEVTLEIDAPGAERWTIDGWAQTWADHAWNETVAAPDIAAAAAYLAPRGRYHAFRLLINGEPAAGLNLFVRGSTLIMMNSARDRRFDRAGAGIHLDELFYRWSGDSAYETVELGGGFEYKQRWADPVHTRARFSVAPAHLALARSGLLLARRIADRARRSPRGGDGQAATEADEA
jgi:hypothetical protein